MERLKKTNVLTFLRIMISYPDFDGLLQLYHFPLKQNQLLQMKKKIPKNQI